MSNKFFKNSNFRRPKKYYNTSGHVNLPESNPSIANLSWRTVSSGIVTRPGSTETTFSGLDVPDTSNQRLEPESEFITACKLTDHLRTPLRHSKASNRIVCYPEDIPGMTRNCENLFCQMLTTCAPVKKEECSDPRSFSVQRIVKGSGLLKSFGTGQPLDIDETREITLEQSPESPCSECQGENSPELPQIDKPQCETKPSFNFDDFMNHSNSIQCDSFLFSESLGKKRKSTISGKLSPNLSDSLENEETRKLDEPSLNRSRTPISFHESSSRSRSPSPMLNQNQPLSGNSSTSPIQYLPSPVFYDTVVLQKTIETEVFEYFPNAFPDATVPDNGDDVPESHSFTNKSYNGQEKMKNRRQRNQMRKKRLSRRQSTTSEHTSSGYDASSSDETTD